MSEKKMSWADIADEEDALARPLPDPPKPIRQAVESARQKLKNLFSKEKTPK